MKKFLGKIALAIFLTFLVGLLKLSFFSKKNRTNSVIIQKFDYLEKHSEYNLLFIGSSRTNNQIDTPYIDSCYSTLKPYNLGANASFNLENFQTLDYILEDSDIHPKIIVLELQSKINLTRENVNSFRSYGVFNNANFTFALQYHWGNKNFYQLGLTAYSYLLNALAFFQEDVEELPNEFVTTYQGFSPLDLTSELSKKTEKNKLEKDIKYRIKFYQNDNKKYPINKVFYERLNRYQQICNQKGIKFILFAPGPAEKDAKKIEVYYPYLKSPIINLMDIEKYPEFYLLENRWDYGHLNQKGAKILSKHLVKELNQIIDKK